MLLNLAVEHRRLAAPLKVPKRIQQQQRLMRRPLPAPRPPADPRNPLNPIHPGTLRALDAHPGLS
ncbi:hypothetical protein GCM10023178_01030 [Actinomadura luteofluorescens]